MSDFSSVGNLVVATVASLSLATWAWIAARWSQRMPAIVPRLRQENVWQRMAGFSAFYLAFAIQVAMFFVKHFYSMWRPLDSHALLALVCLTSILQILVVVGWFRLQASEPWGGMIGLRPIRWRDDLIAGIFGFLASLVPVFAVNILIDKLGWHPPGERHPLLEMLSTGTSPILQIGIIVSAAILAPLAEELLYRVALQTELERYVSPNAALVITAILFAGVHSISGRPDALPLLPLALILGYVYQRTRSYPAVVLLHTLFNGFNLAMTFLVKGAAPH